ncbi:unnamed protein product, partial [Effrenium voratum]
MWRLAAVVGLAYACEEEDCLVLLQQRSKSVRGFSSLSPDPAVLRWHGTPSAGGLSEGTLKVPMDFQDGDSPQLELPVAMRFAATQPAPQGVLLVHCGGPGSDKSCVRYTWGDHLEGYDVWSITQRGMGSASPTLNCDNSRLPERCPEAGCRVSDFTDCPCALPDGMPQLGEIWADVDPRNASQVENLFEKRDEWGPRCAASAKFQLKGKNGKTYNFLSYVGTQFLAYDIDFFRRAVGADLMNVYGYSYGTYVGGVYASVFSEYSGRVVLDGDMEASPRKDVQALGDARANDKFVALLMNTCKSTTGCPLTDPLAQYDAVVAKARQNELTAPTKSGKQFPLSVGLLMAYIQAESISNSGRNFPRVLHTLSQLASEEQSQRQRAVAFILDGFCFVKGYSTWYYYDICVGPGHTNENEESSGVSFADPYLEQCAVWGLDLAGYYDLPDLMRQWRTLEPAWGDAGLAAAVGDMAGYFLWPMKATPTAPMGSSTVQVLVIGNLFDTATSYSWAQDMKRAFPEGSLITWQGMGHTFPSRATDYNRAAIKRCWQHVVDYLQLKAISGVRAVRYEIALENLRRRRSDALRWRKRTISDNAGVVRVHKILRRASFRYKGDVRMWYQHLDFCLRSGSSRVLTHVLMSALKYHPQEVSLWLLSADRELQQGHVDAARKLLFRGLRCAPSSVKLLVEFLRLELGVAGQILQVRQLDAEAGLVEAKVEPDVKDVWGPAKLLFRKAVAKLAGDVVDTATFLRASAELKRGASKWSHTDGFQEWADMLREAAASKRPGVDGAADDQVPPEAAAAIWEVWWTQELEAGTAWPQLAKSVAACGVGRVLARCAQVMQSQLEASELGPLQKLAEANATSADPETALTMLEVLSSVPSKKLQAAYDALRSKA